MQTKKAVIIPMTKYRGPIARRLQGIKLWLVSRQQKADLNLYDNDEPQIHATMIPNPRLI